MKTFLGTLAWPTSACWPFLSVEYRGLDVDRRVEPFHAVQVVPGIDLGAFASRALGQEVGKERNGLICAKTSSLSPG
jgi:hypothetical protein